MKKVRYILTFEKGDIKNKTKFKISLFTANRLVFEFRNRRKIDIIYRKAKRCDRKGNIDYIF